MRAPLRRRPISQQIVALLSAVALLGYGVSVPPPATAGGPLAVGGTFGVSGVPFTWDISLGPIRYTTDTGTLGPLNNTQANTLVQQMFQVWQDVPTSAISYMSDGPIRPNGHVATMADFNAVACPTSGPGSGQNPIVFDADGSLFTLLGFPSGVIGFAGTGPASLSSAGRIKCGFVALNGSFLLGTPPRLSMDAFSAAFIHEFGHFSGLDHSQINVNCLTAPATCPDSSADASGLPTMFPILLDQITEGGVPAQKTLAADDIAWISRLYPETVTAPPGQVPFSTTHGTISGSVFFSDGITQAQGVNVIARQVGNPQRIAVSVVSGYLYTANRGQAVTGNNLFGSAFGSRNPQFAGTFDIPVPVSPLPSYTLEVESILPGFTLGSSVGPLDPPIPTPGTTPPGPIGSPVIVVTVVAGSTVNQNITLVGTPSRFDAFESATLYLTDPEPLWLREESPLLADREAA